MTLNPAAPASQRNSLPLLSSHIHGNRSSGGGSKMKPSPFRQLAKTMLLLKPTAAAAPPPQRRGRADNRAEPSREAA